MRILGIDPGFGRMGFAVVDSEAGSLALCASGVIETDPKQELAARLLAIRRALELLIDEHKPDSASIERLMFVTNRTTGMDVAKAIGVVIISLAERDIPIFEYTPTEVKMTLTGSGRADKKQIEFMVGKLLKLSSTSKMDDETDAMAIAVCHAHSVRMKSLHRVK